VGIDGPEDAEIEGMSGIEWATFICWEKMLVRHRQVIVPEIKSFFEDLSVI
jgi:hypothetical protein